MDYGSIIKRAWQITWKYKALWVLGIFAGVSGCQGSGGGGNGGGGNSFRSGADNSGPDIQQFLSTLQQWIPVIIAGVILLTLVGIVWWILGIAARGGLVAGVNRIEEGQAAPLGDLWATGFSRFWSLLGLELLLRLPIFIVAVGTVVGVVAPLFGSMAGGRDPGAEVIAPICGSLAIGLPILLVLSFVLGIMELIAKRYLMLGRQSVVESAGNSWRFLRLRLKDSFFMWLISGALNFAASLVLAIPIVIIALVIAIPAGLAAWNESWEALVPVVLVGTVLIMLISFLYAGIWGTFTSALWTIFFRRVTGLEMPSIAAPMPVTPAMPYGYEQPPAAPDADRYVGAPPMAPPQSEYPPYPPKPPTPGD